MRTTATILALLAVVPVSFAQDPVFDDFERHSLGPNWTVYGGSQAGIVADSDLGVPDTSWCFVGWTASSFGADQGSQATLSTDIDPVMLTQVYGRRRSTDGARYGFHWNGDPGNSQWEIKYDGVPTPQTRILACAPGAGPAPGDALRIEIRGTDPVVIHGFHQGQLVLTATDGAPERITTAGVAGVVARTQQGAVNNPPTAIFEDWSGGTLPWVDLGGGTPGIAGVPTLAGHGLLTAGSTLGVSLRDAAPNALAILFVSISSTPVPFLGGTFHPFPFLYEVVLVTDGGGGFFGSTGFPGGISGEQIWFQAGVVDPSVPIFGAVLSRAEVGTVP